MCLILFAHQCHARLPLLLLANRDEYLDRPTAKAAAWPELPEIVGGRDQVSGGTWLGISRGGRWAAITNIRDGERTQVGGPSRGWLARDFLLGAASPKAYASELAGRGETYAGFNLLVGTREEVWYVDNRENAPQKVLPGIYGLSNGRLDAPWPKVRHGKTALAHLLTKKHLRPEQGFCILADKRISPDKELPNTGIPLAWERALSATFINVPERNYGTRSSTVVMYTSNGQLLLMERSFTGSPTRWSQCIHRTGSECRAVLTSDKNRKSMNSHDPL